MSLKPTTEPLGTRRKSKSLKKIKDFEKAIRRDVIELKYTDGRQLRQPGAETTHDKYSRILNPNKPGISTAVIETSAYQGRKFEIIAGPNSAMILRNGGTSPLNEGFWLIWSADVTKDPDAKAQLAIRVK